MPRGPRLDAPGTLHHVMLRGIERRRIVDNDTDREDFVTRMGTVAMDTETAIYAWALMTNHAHILLRSGTAGLPAFMRRFLSAMPLCITGDIGATMPWGTFYTPLCQHIFICCIINRL